MKKGFTLVELSIVLVIIGLLIGGILVGQSLINTAKINSIVSQLQQYEIAINQFKSKYKTMPGDSKSFAPTGAPDNMLSWGDTNSDGIQNVTACNGAYSNNEVFQFWAHLSQAKMINKTYPTYSPATCGGTHTSAQFNSGDIIPYIAIPGEVESMLIGYGVSKMGLVPNKFSATTNLYFGLYFAPIDGLAFTSKVGGKLNDGTNTQVGLTTGSFAMNKCGDATYQEVDCSSTTAVYMDALYYMSI